VDDERWCGNDGEKLWTMLSSAIAGFMRFVIHVPKGDQIEPLPQAASPFAVAPELSFAASSFTSRRGTLSNFGGQGSFVAVNDPHYAAFVDARRPGTDSGSLRQTALSIPWQLARAAIMAKRKVQLKRSSDGSNSEQEHGPELEPDDDDDRRTSPSSSSPRRQDRPLHTLTGG
jgi:hypothetical protein